MNRNKKMRTVFRVFPEGDVIALFPNEESSPGYISSYQLVGQHGDASPELIRELRPAIKEEYGPLLKELKRIGYKNIVVGRK